MRVTVLAGGVGGGRFLKAVAEYQQVHPEALQDITAIVNISDDMWFEGLRICPDLDTITYTVAGINDSARGWGRAGDSERVHQELQAYGLGRPWFTLGDLDLATSIARTRLLTAGHSLTETTATLTKRWDLPIRLLPASDNQVETHVRVRGHDEPDLHFQEWWVRYRANLPVHEFHQVGLEQATVTHEARRALEDADLIVLAPSNPVVSIATILAIPGVRDALAKSAAPVVGVSPIINDTVIRGRADVCLEAVGVRTSAAAVADWYGATTDGGLLHGWLVDPIDRSKAEFRHNAGIDVQAVPLLLDTVERREAVIDTIVKMGARLSPLTGCTA